MEFFKERGLDFSILNKNGHSALHKAAIKGNMDACKWLMSPDGGSLEGRHCQPDDGGFAPSTFAINNGFPELSLMLQEFEKNCAVLGESSADGSSPLY